MSQEKNLNPADVAIGAAIRRRREALNITQAQLADAAGVTFQQIQKYERGSNRVAAARLMQIADKLRCHPADLLGVSAEAPGDALADLGRTHDGVALARCFVEMTPEDRQALMIIARALAAKPKPTPTQLRPVA